MDTKESTLKFYERLTLAYDRTKRAMQDREAYNRTIKDFKERMEGEHPELHEVENNPYLSK